MRLAVKWGIFLPELVLSFWKGQGECRNVAEGPSTAAALPQAATALLVALSLTLPQ
jgi:hypothetical protein